MPTFTATTKDELIDFLIDSFTKDPHTGYDADAEACVYRGPEGRQCAFGRCLTDEEVKDYVCSNESAQDVLDNIQAWEEDATAELFLAIGVVTWWDDLQAIHDAWAVAESGKPSDIDARLLNHSIPELYARWREIGYPEIGDVASVYAILYQRTPGIGEG